MDQQAIDRLRQQLEAHLNWGDASSWHSSMFSELSDDIFEKSSVMLSPTTLKRFFGVVSHDVNPSVSTLDALSKYLGYENWRAYKIAGPLPKPKKANTFPKKSLYMTIGFFLALVMILIVGNKRVEDPEVLAAISFSSRPVTNSYPNSVVFDFDLKGVRSDSLFIQQYWDPTKTIKISTDQKQATGIYYIPGYFNAKLLIDGQTIKQHELFLRSNGWIGTIDYDPVPKYFNITSNSLLNCPVELRKEVQDLEDPISCTFHYVTDLGNISGDNFSLSSTIKVGWNEKWAVCQSARIFILGTDGALIIPFANLGCSSSNNVMLNDNYVSGKENDLSMFATDLSNETPVVISVENKTVSVTIANNKVYEAAYNETMGRVVGIRYKFLGYGEVSSFSLTDQTGSEILGLASTTNPI